MAPHPPAVDTLAPPPQATGGRRLSILIFDPSEHHRPEFKVQDDSPEGKDYRTYKEDVDDDPWAAVVKKTYLDMHTNQTVDFVKEKMGKWTRFNHFEANIFDALDKLNDLIDESDGDTQLPNIVHAFQTAERLRKDYPEHGWLHLTGLIHDLGKIMAMYGEPQLVTSRGKPQWCVVGDTWPVGCKPQPSIVFRDSSFGDNPDMKDERYNTDLGIYTEGCGLRKVTMSWGHDEYLYRVLKHNNSTLPDQALYIIRFHSFYPLHTGGDYHEFLDDHDKRMLKWIKMFTKYDLYTKSEEEDDIPDIEKLKPYYQQLIDQYCPGVLKW